MMRKMLSLFILIVLFIVTGCVNEKNDEKEEFMLSATVDDGRVIHFTFDVPHAKGDSVMNEISNARLTIDEFISNLELVDGLNDGGSKIYKYNRKNKVYGNEDFYVIECDNFDGIKDVFVAKNKENIINKCSIKIDDLDGVSMAIKDGSLTRVGATIIITDTSKRENIYGDYYRIDKWINGEWEELDTIIDNYAFNMIGYTVNSDNILELVVDWEWLYGKLEDGKYRIVKDTSEIGEGTKHYITAGFTIK